jgi:hypothetical protein
MNIICYLLPSFVSAGILINLKAKSTLQEILVSLMTYISLFVLLITLANYTMLIVCFNYSGLPIDFALTSMSFVVKYISLSLMWGILLPLLYWNISKNISIEFKENKFCKKRK